VRKNTRYLIGSADAVWYCAVACLLLVFVAGLFVSASGIGVEGYPGDAELTKRFLAHKNDFTALGSMLDRDGGVLRESHQPVDLGVLTTLGSARAARYQTLLTNLRASALRYLPESQDTAMLVSPGEPSNTARVCFVHVGRGDVTPVHHEAVVHYWRGPGIYETTRDSPVGSGWFIRRKVGVNVVFPPY
jgi:hypothetical protein